MADPLSPAVSIIAVVQFTGSLVSLAYEYLWGLSEAPDDLQKLVDELQSLGKVLAGLRNHAQADKEFQHSPLREISGRGGPLWECSSELKGLKLKLESKEGSNDITNGLSWPLNEKEVLLRISRVRKHKSILALALQVMEDQLRCMWHPGWGTYQLLVDYLSGERTLISEQKRTNGASRGSTGGHKEVVELLLKHTEQNDISETANFWTTREGRMQMSQILLNPRTDLWERDEDGKSVLHWAARRGHKEIVELLLESGAEISDCGKGEQSPLHEATRGGHDEVVQLLLERGAGVWSTEECGETALHEAAWAGHKGIVQLLLENGADISAQARGVTALHRAAYRGYIDVVRLLVEKGANVSISVGGQNALCMAAIGGHKAVIQFLHENGADISTRDKSGDTALYEAAKGGHKDVVELLLENGGDSDISVQGYYGQPLSVAASEGHGKTVQISLFQMDKAVKML